jgi:RNA polymerase sigma-70 factor (ECF subfamily)
MIMSGHGSTAGRGGKERTMSVATVEQRQIALQEERRWVAAARAGDGVAFGRIYEQYGQRVYRLARRMLGNPDDAQDITQDTFVTAWQNLERTSEDLYLGAWLTRIAANKCLDLLRRRKRIHWSAWDPAVHDQRQTSSVVEQPEQAALRRAEAEDVQAVLGRLQPRYRLALLLREGEQLSVLECAQAMGVSESAMKTILFRARAQFRAISAGEPVSRFS